MQKKFIFKSLWFIIPIFLTSIFTFKFNSRKGNPDLLRLGYIINLYPDYLNLFSKEFENKINFTKFSEQNPKKNYKILTIGDSFSEQAEEGYKNYLSKNPENSLLHLDRFLFDNQIEALYSLLNGDFFDKFQFEYVILQNVERNIIENNNNLNKKKVLNLIDLNEILQSKSKPKIENHGLNFFSDFKFPSNNIFKFPFYTYQYFNNNTYLFDGQVYKTKTSDNFFSVGSNDLLFYQNDLVASQKNNSEKDVLKLNNHINELNNLLKKKNVKLIFLPCPDKYSIYHKYIVDKSNFPRPMFFDHLQKLPKEYILIDSKTILDSAVKNTKDLYFYDDTHWSPWASKIIAKNIESKMN